MPILLFLSALTMVGCEAEPPTAHKIESRTPFLEATQQDRIIQTNSPSADVLFVVDTSASMSEEQSKLVTNFPIFLNYFIESELDWHVGVISMDMDDTSQQGKLQSADGYRFIDQTVPDPQSTFADMIPGPSGAFQEQGLATSHAALETLNNSYNAGFMRDDASLSIVVISDEDDQSHLPLGQYITWLLDLKPSADMVTFSSIVGPYQPCYCSVEPGSRYLQVTDATGGIKWSICTEDWVQLFDEPGVQTAGLKREFFLTERPIVETIELWVIEGGNTLIFEYDDGRSVQPEKAFNYDSMRNSISFVGYVPGEIAEVYIEYEVASAEKFDGDT
ncbi:MAG: VWA domain-containing protein, partial [Proteobacteria bacterium]|nr:VWA domain-containing protein [Pseudomonadota bacterium]